VSATVKNIVIATIVLSALIVQVWLLHGQAYWGFYSPFPFTMLREVKAPLLIAVSAVPVWHDHQIDIATTLAVLNMWHDCGGNGGDQIHSMGGSAGFSHISSPDERIRDFPVP
jgi:hypothetical protein